MTKQTDGWMDGRIQNILKHRLSVCGTVGRTVTSEDLGSNLIISKIFNVYLHLTVSLGKKNSTYEEWSF